MVITTFFGDNAQDDPNPKREILHLGLVYVGITQADAPYASYEYHKPSAKDAFKIQIGRNEKGEHVVASIERTGTNVDTAWKGIAALNLPTAAQNDMAKKLTEPDEIVFGGVQFTVNGPATGKLVDPAEFEKPDVQAVLKEAAQNFYYASFVHVDFVTPHTQAPAAPGAKVGGPAPRA